MGAVNNVEWLDAPALRTLHPSEIIPGMVVRRTYLIEKNRGDGARRTTEVSAFRVENLVGDGAETVDGAWFGLSYENTVFELIENAPDPVAELGKQAYSIIHPKYADGPWLPSRNNVWYKLAQKLHDQGVRSL